MSSYTPWLSLQMVRWWPQRAATEYLGYGIWPRDESWQRLPTQPERLYPMILSTRRRSLVGTGIRWPSLQTAGSGNVGLQERQSQCRAVVGDQDMANSDRDSSAGGGAIGFSKDGRQLAIVGEGSVRVWNMDRAVKGRSSDWQVPFAKNAYCCEFSPNDSALVVGGRSGSGGGPITRGTEHHRV